MSYFCTEKPYARWASLLILIPILTSYLFNEFIDQKFGLCSVRCRHSYGEGRIPSLDTSIVGDRPMFAPDRCDCYAKTNSFTTRFLGSISWHETRPAPSSLASKEKNICGVDGRDYPTQHSACTNETYPLHGGSCGACSNEQDIDVYRRTSQSMSVLAYQCMVKYLAGTEKSAFACFQTAGLSNDCNQCWIDNMKCSASACLWKCVWHNMIRGIAWSDSNSTLNPCIQCDEEMCGPNFVTCAGANRRRAGIVSDISRPNVDVWKRTAC